MGHPNPMPGTLSGAPPRRMPGQQDGDGLPLRKLRETCPEAGGESSILQCLSSPGTGLLDHDPRPGMRRGAGQWLANQPRLG